MRAFWGITSQVHNLILVCGFTASIGFGMLIAFNKRVAEEKADRAVVVMGVSMSLQSLSEVRVGDI